MRAGFQSMRRTNGTCNLLRAHLFSTSCLYCGKCSRGRVCKPIIFADQIASNDSFGKESTPAPTARTERRIIGPQRHECACSIVSRGALPRQCMTHRGNIDDDVVAGGNGLTRNGRRVIVLSAREVMQDSSVWSNPLVINVTTEDSIVRSRHAQLRARWLSPARTVRARERHEPGVRSPPDRAR